MGLTVGIEVDAPDDKTDYDNSSNDQDKRVSGSLLLLLLLLFVCLILLLFLLNILLLFNNFGVACLVEVVPLVVRRLGVSTILRCAIAIFVLLDIFPG